MPAAFVSHSSKDRQLVESHIIQPLRDRGITAWYAKEDIVEATRWAEEIRNGLEACDWFLLAMSSNAAASPWVKDEVEWAFMNRRSRIIPLRFDDCDVRAFHFAIASIQHLDFRSDPVLAKKRLVAALTIKPAPSPSLSTENMLADLEKLLAGIDISISQTLDLFRQCAPAHWERMPVLFNPGDQLLQAVHSLAKAPQSPKTQTFPLFVFIRNLIARLEVRQGARLQRWLDQTASQMHRTSATPARVKVNYEVLTKSGTEHIELPFVIGVIADLSGRPLQELPPLLKRDFVEINRVNFDRALNCSSARAAFQVPNLMADAGGYLDVELRFHQLRDFDPDIVLTQVSALRNLWEETRKMVGIRRQRSAMESNIKKISAQLRRIIHHPEFQKLEGTWRGLDNLTRQAQDYRNVKIRVLNCAKFELFRDLDKAVEFDQSKAFKKIYDQEYATLGGEPFGLLMADFDFSPDDSIDISMLRKLSNVAAASHAPIVAAAASSINRNPSTLSSDSDRAEWRSFRDDLDTRYVALTFPRVAGRRSFVASQSSAGTFPFDEFDANDSSHSGLWISGAWAYATVAARSFGQYGWFDSIQFDRDESLIGGFPVAGTSAPKNPNGGDGGGRMAEFSLNQEHGYELAIQGFIPIIRCDRRGTLHFLRNATCHLPRPRIASALVDESMVSCNISYLLCLGRFAHHVKSLCREKATGNGPPAFWNDWINRWINQFVVSEWTNEDDLHVGRRVLLEGSVTIQPVAGKPRWAELVFYLRLQTPFEGATALCRMCAEFGPWEELSEAAIRLICRIPKLNPEELEKIYRKQMPVRRK